MSPGLIDRRTHLVLIKGAKALVWLFYAVVFVVFIMLGFGFFLRLAGANPEARFAAWVYRNVDRSMDPFRGIFPTETITDRSVFDSSLLFAAVIYGLVALALHALVLWLSARIERVEDAGDHDPTLERPLAGPSVDRGHTGGVATTGSTGRQDRGRDGALEG